MSLSSSSFNPTFCLFKSPKVKKTSDTHHKKTFFSLPVALAEDETSSIAPSSLSSIDFLSGVRTLIAWQRYRRATPREAANMSLNWERASSDSGRPSFSVSIIHLGSEVSPWQHGCDPVPGELLIGRGVEADGCAEVAAVSRDVCTCVLCGIR